MQITNVHAAEITEYNLITIFPNTRFLLECFNPKLTISFE